MKKRLLAIILVILLLCGSLLTMTACGGDDNEADERHSYTMWITQGEDATCYTDYNENPVMRYFNSLEFLGDDGELHNTYIDVISGVISEARSNFNTMIATRDYYDILDMAQTDYSALELYNDGVVLDLTPYIEAGAMPHYVAWLEANPDYAKTATVSIDGKKHYLQLFAYHDELDNWGGWQYRRDWIVTYGENPSTGESFTSGIDENGLWTDNVVFPSYYDLDLRNSYLQFDPAWDGSVPVFISDWEWMLDIFAKAIDAQSLTEGYPMSLYYPGYIEVGQIITGFGGGSAVWYKDGDTVKFGATSDGFKTYLECMRTWYANGWIDQTFDTRSSDIFYQIDTPNMYNGRVGLFYGNENTTLDKLRKIGEATTENIFITSAREPINDKYGTGSVKYTPGVNEFIPNTFYQSTKEQNSFVLTEKMNDKDIIGFLSMYDHLFEPNGGSRLTNMGLTKAQYDTIAQEGDWYDRLGIADTGSYFVKAEIGMENTNNRDCIISEVIGSDPNKRNPSELNRIGGLQNDQLDWKSPEYLTIHKQWDFYTAKGNFLTSFIAQLTPEESRVYNTTLVKMRTLSNVEIPKFIKGEYNLTSDWTDYCRTINRYGVNSVTQSLQALLDKIS